MRAKMLEAIRPSARILLGNVVHCLFNVHIVARLNLKESKQQVVQPVLQQVALHQTVAHLEGASGFLQLCFWMQ